MLVIFSYLFELVTQNLAENLTRSTKLSWEWYNCLGIVAELPRSRILSLASSSFQISNYYVLRFHSGQIEVFFDRRCLL